MWSIIVIRIGIVWFYNRKNVDSLFMIFESRRMKNEEINEKNDNRPIRGLLVLENSRS